MGKTVLVTGCAGLIGSWFSSYLCDQGYNVIGVDNLAGGYHDFVDDRVRFYKFDLRNSNVLEQVFQQHNDIEAVYVFHAFASVGVSHFLRNFVYQNNVVSTMNVINACVNHNVDKLVFASSMDVFKGGCAPFSELSPKEPSDPYGIGKLTIELDLKAAKEQFGLNYSIVRPHNVFGSQQNIWDRYRNVLGIWIRKCINNEPITVYGDGSQVRAFSDVKYYMKPLEKLMSHIFDGEDFNVGADKPITILEAAKITKKVAQKYGSTSDIVHLEPRNEVHTAYCDHAKAKKLLGFKDETDVEELIDTMYKWALTQPEREVKTMPYEIAKGLYSYWK